MIKDDQNKTI